jgi:hypothetical protein
LSNSEVEDRLGSMKKLNVKNNLAGIIADQEEINGI